MQAATGFRTIAALAALAVLSRAAGALDVAEIAKRCEPGVLVIHGEKAGSAVQSSGGCVSADGLILTTAHQVNGVGNLVGRTAGGLEVKLSVVEMDAKRELALLKADKPLPSALALGHSSRLRSGAPLVCIAAPKSLEFTTVAGIVSNVDRTYRGSPVIQTDFRVSPGSSGGPVFDQEGKLVGLVIGKLSDQEWVTVVNPIANAFDLLARHGVTVPAAHAGSDELGELVPADALSEMETRAVEAFNKGRRAEGTAEKIKYYALAAKLLPTFYEAWFNLGVASERAGELDGALAALDKAAALPAADGALQRSRGRVLMAQNKFEDAEKAFAAALAKEPGSARAHTELGEAYRREGKLEDAAKLFDKAIGLDKGYALAYYNLGVTRAQQERNADAIAAFEKYLGAAPGASDAGQVQATIETLKRK